MEATKRKKEKCEGENLIQRKNIFINNSLSHRNYFFIRFQWSRSHSEQLLILIIICRAFMNLLRSRKNEQIYVRLAKY